MPPESPTAEDDFNKFFADLSSLAAEKKPIPADFGAPEPVAAAEPVVEPVAEPVAAAEPVVEPVAEPVEAPKVDSEALLARFVAAMEAQKPAPQPQAEQPAPKLYTDEEIEALTTAEKEWPDLLKAMQLLVRGSTVANNAAIMQQFGQTLAPALQNIDAVAEAQQRAALHAAIPDYATVRDPAIQWATTDPSIPPRLRSTYKDVIENGEVSEIKWLVDDYRRATGKSVSSKTVTPTSTKPANELSEAAKQAAASLAPVVSKRTVAVTTEVDPNDFVGAFTHYAAAKR